LYEYNILKHFLALFGKHSDALRLGRTYWIWLIVQPVLFFIYTGIPTSILFFRRLITRFNEIKTETTIPFAITLLILSLSGIMGGEVPRMWMYFVPFVCMTAAKELESMGSKHIIYVIVILLFTQVILFKVCTVSSFMPWYTSL
jgi:hypothetical protein